MHKGLRALTFLKPLLACGPLIAAASSVAVITTLLFTKVGPTVEQRLPDPGGDQLVVNLERLDEPGRGSHFIFSGTLSDGSLLNGVSEVKILVGTHFKTLQLRRGAIRFGGTGCEYLAKNQTVLDNTRIIFSRRTPCRDHSTAPLLYSFDATFRDNTPLLALWSLPFTEKPGFWYQVKGGKYFAQMIVGRPDPNPMTRLSLLLFMWRDASGAIIGTLVASALLFLISGYLFCRPRAGSYRQAGAQTLALVAFCLLYAAITPPFHGPDEPDHFLSLSRVVGDPKFEKKALDLAAVGHFNEIKQVIARHFGPKDIEFPLGGTWPQKGVDTVSDSYMEVRSPATFFSWTLIKGLLVNQSVEVQLIALRLLHTILVGIAFLLLALVCAYISPANSFSTAAVALLLVPALPFFSMHVSNYPLFIAAHMVAGAGMILIQSPKRYRMAGPVLVGLGISLSVLSTRLGLALMAPAAPILAAFITFGNQQRPFLGKAALKDVGIGLFGYIIGLMPFIFLDPGQWVGMASDYLKGLGTSPFIDLLIRFPQSAVVLLSVFFILIFYLCFAWMREKVCDFLTKHLSAFKRFAFLAFICIIWVSIKQSHWAVPDIDYGVNFGSRWYLLLCARTFIKDMGFAAPDFYLTRSFWTGFGWLDVPMPAFVAGFLSAVPLLVVTLTVWVADLKAVLSLVRGKIFALSLVLYLMICAFLAFSVSYNIHGRYLAGFFVLYLLGVGLCLDRLKQSGSQVIRGGIVLGLPSLVFGLHGMSAVYILLRYFG